MPALETVEREEVPVIFKRADGDTPDAIQRAWADFETVVGLKGRRFFGVFYAVTNEYHVCAQRKEEDDPEALEVEVGKLPGGTYLSGRIEGEPPEIYDRILLPYRK